MDNVISLGFLQGDHRLRLGRPQRDGHHDRSGPAGHLPAVLRPDRLAAVGQARRDPGRGDGNLSRDICHIK